MQDDSKYCWQCRLTSGLGLMGAGAYVVHHGRKLQNISRIAVTTIGYGIAGIGTLRLFGLPPFKPRKELKKAVENKDEDEYVMGRFSPKF